MDNTYTCKLKVKSGSSVVTHLFGGKENEELRPVPYALALDSFVTDHWPL